MICTIVIGTSHILSLMLPIGQEKRMSFSYILRYDLVVVISSLADESGYSKKKKTLIKRM